jgi:predicted DNA-binding transcriptional regulator AlpA
MVFDSLSAAPVLLSGLPNEALVRQQQLISYGVIPFSPSTLWRKVKAQEFPAPIKVSSHITAWRMSDIRAWATNPAAYRASEASHV